jgi:hypothetical protein
VSGHAERLAALDLIAPHGDRGRAVTLGADKGYDAKDFVMELRERNVHPHVAQNSSGQRLGDRPAHHPASRVCHEPAHPQADRGVRG